MPASTRERRFAFGVIVLLLVTFLIIAPFASVPLAPGRCLHSGYLKLFYMRPPTSLPGPALLFAQYSIEPLRGVLAFACGYIFSGLFCIYANICVPRSLTPRPVCSGT